MLQRQVVTPDLEYAPPAAAWIARGAYPAFREALPTGETTQGRYRMRFAAGDDDLDAILRLRFDVFNLELGEGMDASFETGRDEDEFDPLCHHLMVEEAATGRLVGTYRMMTSSMAGLAVTALGIVLSFVPPPDVSSVWVFEGKLAGGFGLIAVMGRLCFQRFRPAAQTG